MKTSSQKAPHSRANSSDNGAASSTVHRVALTRAETAEALGVSPRSVDMLIAGRRVNGLPVVYIGRKPIQFVVNTLCDDALKDKEVEISVEIRERGTDELIFETFWVTTLTHLKQQSAFIFREFPDELTKLVPGKIYTYYANALVNETDELAERTTRATAR